jgi:hypothetical protein
MATSTNFSNWDFHKYRVQQELTGGQFVNAESTLVAAGPPSLSGVTGGVEGDSVYPIALLETFGLQQSRQLQRIFEIGSSRSYFVPGRTIGSVSLGRTFYFGPSLLRVLYAYWNGSFDTNSSALGDQATAVADPALNGHVPLLGYAKQRDLFRNPGYGYMLIDLASDLFAQPTGMAIYFKDANNETFGGFYLEQSYVQGHQLTVSSGSVLIMEGVSIQYDLLVPLDLGAKAA